jgi:hypothetical protein
MLSTAKNKEISIGPAKVMAAYPDERIVSIKWLNRPTDRHNVMVVTDPNSYSFPQVGDCGLVISVDNYDYFIGKLEYRYADKINGTSEGRTKDASGQDIYAKKVQPGDVFLAPLLRATSLFLSKTGGMSLSAKSGDGLVYYAYNRLAKLKAKATIILGQGVTAAFGKVMRDLGAGLQVIPNVDLPTTPSVESLIDVTINTFRMARLHLGHVLNSVGVPELGSIIPTARLRAILEVCTASVPIAVLKMDELGHIELSSTIGKIMIDSTAPVPLDSILLGGSLLTLTQHAVWGELLIDWLNNHTHPTSMGPTSTPTIPALPATLLSKKVLVG